MDTLRPDGKTTPECLWLSSSSTGNYHENMNSNNFMRWVEEKFVPTFEQMFPGKIMVPVMDNAPYHHKQVLRS
eukprot:8696219-Ditylum_brightwellii.AAC.1